jgi:hypothetical protein
LQHDIQPPETSQNALQTGSSRTAKSNKRLYYYIDRRAEKSLTFAENNTQLSTVVFYTMNGMNVNHEVYNFIP